MVSSQLVGYHYLLFKALHSSSNGHNQLIPCQCVIHNSVHNSWCFFLFYSTLHIVKSSRSWISQQLVDTQERRPVAAADIEGKENMHGCGWELKLDGCPWLAPFEAASRERRAAHRHQLPSRMRASGEWQGRTVETRVAILLLWVLYAHSCCCTSVLIGSFWPQDAADDRA